MILSKSIYHLYFGKLKEGVKKKIVKDVEKTSPDRANNGAETT